MPSERCASRSTSSASKPRNIELWWRGAGIGASARITPTYVFNSVVILSAAKNDRSMDDGVTSRHARSIEVGSRGGGKGCLRCADPGMERKSGGLPAAGTRTHDEIKQT